jgi:hypothetical protein
MERDWFGEMIPQGMEWNGILSLKIKMSLASEYNSPHGAVPSPRPYFTSKTAVVVLPIPVT